MTRTKAAIAAACVAITAIAAPASAQYLQAPGVAGGASAAGYEGWIELNSVTQTVTRATPASGPGQIALSTRPGTASAALRQAAAAGTEFATMTLAAPGAGARAPYLKYKLEKVRIVSYSVNSAGIEEMVLSYEAISLPSNASAVQTNQSDLNFIAR